MTVAPKQTWQDGRRLHVSNKLAPQPGLLEISIIVLPGSLSTVDSRGMDKDRWICQICGLSIHRTLYGGPLSEDIETGELVNPPELKDFGNLEDMFRWLTEARLLCDPDDEFGSLLPNYAEKRMHQLPGYDDLPNTSDMRPRSQASDIEVHVAEADEELKLLRVDPDGCRQHVSFQGSEGYSFDDRICAAVHSECLDIAERVFASSTLTHARDLRGLWTALRWRQSITSQCSGSSGYFPQANYTLSRNDYYVPQPTVAGEPTWRKKTSLGWIGLVLILLLYQIYTIPLEIEELTSCLLQNLRACRSKVTRTKKGTILAGNLSKLPTEILDNILAAMGRYMPPESSRLLPQRLWKDQLKAGSRGLLPWLWDIDPACVDAKDSEPCPGDVPDTIRATPGVTGLQGKPTMAGTGYYTDLAHVPAGLHNRRRIWQLLEEMFVGDTLPWPARQRCRYACWSRRETQKQGVPLCWDKTGNILARPIWLPSIEFGYSDNPTSEGHPMFFKRLGGGVYKRRGKARPQYWQRREVEKKHGNETGETEQQGDTETPAATVEEIYAILRKLGYPNASMFTHAPLNESRREIRLVRIRPPPDEQISAKNTIALEIKHASLNEPELSFAALSYVWGSATDTTPIEIEGASFSVTLNLHAALQQLQMNSVDSWLWIDALCIEQANLEEKSWQIGTMRDIFSGADIVYVWLGPGNEKSDLAMDFISRTGNTLHKYGVVDWRSTFRDYSEIKLYIQERFSPQGEAINSSESMRTVEEAYRMTEDSTPQEKSEVDEREHLMRFKFALYDIFCDFFGHRSLRISEAIRDLLHREYWQRIWVIQEVVLARTATVAVAGNRSVSLDIFDAALRILREYRWAVPLDVPSWTRFIVPMQGSLIRIRPLEVRYRHHQGVRVRLEDILWKQVVAPERPHYSATDPRDILFGLLGVLEESEKQNLRVDYSLSKEDVFVNITTILLDSPGGGPSRFRLDSTVPGDRNGTLPTWVPDWQVIGRYGRFALPISYIHEFEAAAQRQQRQKASDCLVIRDGRTSILQEGCYVDKVTEVMAPPVWEQVDVYTAPTLKRPDGWFLSIIEFAGLGPEPDSEEDHIWRILRHANYRKIKDNPQYAITPGVTDLWRRIMRVQSLDAATLTTEEREFIITDNRNLRHPSRSDEHIIVSNEDLRRFAQNARIYLNLLNRNRTLFKTAKGRVGLGHVGVEVDDVVTLIWGAYCPVVLKERSEGHFYFGGDAYLDGMMFGEFLETEPAEVEFRIF
ncbi:hypothetical protein CSPX01_06109 [Colletotrichum filicis]|nr:hypothetical protein CSPX01_06109 [Colletotrichum filicis]